MEDSIIISVAPVRAGTPVDADALAEDIRQCVQNGASMCHLHCREPSGALTGDIAYMAQCFDRILAETDVIPQVSTGGISHMSIQERCRPLQYPLAETASLNAGSTNLGDDLYVNTFADIAYCAQETYERGILPDVEVFDIGMIQNIEMIAQRQPFCRPILYNLVFGHRGGMPASIDALIAFRSMVPRDAKWGVTHYGRMDWRFLSAAIAMGALTVRIGFEDSAYLAPGQSALHNYELVKHLSGLIRSMGLMPASVPEARRLLGLIPKSGQPHAPKDFAI